MVANRCQIEWVGGILVIVVVTTEAAMKFLTVVIAFAVAGCASQIMGKYVGQDIREVALTYGPPSNSFDYRDGLRVFQWISTTSITMPSTSTTTGSATVVGNSVWMNSNTHITSPQTVKPKIFGPLMLLGISVVESNFLRSSTVRISPDSCRPMIHVA